MKLRFPSLAVYAAFIVVLSAPSVSAQTFVCQESDGDAHGDTESPGAEALHGGAVFLEVSDDGVLGYTLADNATLLAGQVIETLSWEGAYVDNFSGLTSCAPFDDFRLTVYGDDGSGIVPDASNVVATYTFGSAVNRTPTGETIPEFVPKDVYEYTAQLTPALAIPSTGTYWFEIANDTPPNPGSCGWAWRTAPPGDAHSALYPGGIGWFGTHEFDLDLCLSGFTRFAGDVPEISLGAGGSQVLSLDAGPSGANWFYWVFGSVLGTLPGLDFGGGVVLPLNYGPYFKVTLEKPNLGAFGNFLGQFDAQGGATATFSLPAGLDPGLAGVTLHHAYLAAEVFGIPDFASNAVPVSLMP